MINNFRSIFKIVVTTAIIIMIVSCASKDERITKPYEHYLYTTSDKNVSIYYNVLATRIDFTIKNITDSGFGDFKVETKCSMKGGFIAENFNLGQIKQYFTKTFFTKFIHRDCAIITLEYSYIPNSTVAEFKSRRSSEDTYSTLPLTKRVSGNIVIKSYANRSAN